MAGIGSCGTAVSVRRFGILCMNVCRLAQLMAGLADECLNFERSSLCRCYRSTKSTLTANEDHRTADTSSRRNPCKSPYKTSPNYKISVVERVRGADDVAVVSASGSPVIFFNASQAIVILS